MIKFIKYFVYEWRKYPRFNAYRKCLKKKSPKAYAEMEGADAERGIKPYKNRLDYAWRNAKIRWSHRDRYGRKCRKHGGNCEKCNARHC